MDSTDHEQCPKCNAHIRIVGFYVLVRRWFGAKGGTEQPIGGLRYCGQCDALLPAEKK